MQKVEMKEKSIKKPKNFSSFFCLSNLKGVQLNSAPTLLT